jgi:predicted transcriptional regulator
MIKYEQEIKEIFKEIFDIKEDDIEQFFVEIEKETSITIQRLSDEIEIGVKNGYSMESQFEILKIVLKPMIDRKK